MVLGNTVKISFFNAEKNYKKSFKGYIFKLPRHNKEKVCDVYLALNNIKRIRLFKWPFEKEVYVFTANEAYAKRIDKFDASSFKIKETKIVLLEKLRYV